MIIPHNLARAYAAAYNLEFMEMSAEHYRNVPRKAEAPNRRRDMLSMHYREIGIPAVAAALEATASKPLIPPQSREEALNAGCTRPDIFRSGLTLRDELFFLRSNNDN
jgi:hypothetical protein